MNRGSLAQDIFDELQSIPTVDAHEHLPTEESRVARPVDCFDLFHHYCVGDLVAAGATDKDLAFWGDKNEPLSDRWTRFKPFFAAIRTGAYARSVLLVVRDLLGFDDLNDDTFEGVSRKLQAGNTPGLYDRILRERCHIVACIQCWQLGQSYPGYFHHLAPGPELTDIFGMPNVNQLSERHGVAIHSLLELLDCMSKAVETWRANPVVVGIKSAHAYVRTIQFRKTPRAEAERVFDQILNHAGRKVSPPEAVPLQDFLMFELVARAEACGLPMVFHTGIQAGNRGRILNADPLLLQELLESFPRARFDLFHGGMPWVREIAILAKYFPNVHLNMAWMHIINPAQARSALSEWLDMLPNTKIFGFGGDYNIVEKVYGHLTLARRNIADVLAQKVTEGTYSRAEAGMVARRLMLENPRDFYKLRIE
jgi:hypothetical protein